MWRKRKKRRVKKKGRRMKEKEECRRALAMAIANWLALLDHVTAICEVKQAIKLP